MSSFDVFAVVHELKTLEDARLENIYQIENIFLFVFRKIGQEKQILLVEPEVRVHLTRFERPKPKFPPNFCMALRRHLRGAKVLQVFQPNFDRIIGVKLERGGIHMTMVIELFKRGTLIVVREEGTILMSHRYRKMRDRDILPGKPFQYPPLVGHNIFSITRENLGDLLGKSEGEVVRTLARALNLGGLYAEEIIQHTNIAKDQFTTTLTEADLDALWSAISTISSKLRASPPDLNPIIISNENQLVDVIPFSLKRYVDSNLIHLHPKPTMNEALDEYFMESEKKKNVSTLQIAKKEKPVQRKIKTKGTEESRLENQLKRQERRLEELHEQSEQATQLGTLLMGNLILVEEITSTILKARKDGYNWDEIEKKLQEGREKGIESAQRIQSIDPEQGLVTIDVEGTLIKLDFTKKVTTVAQNYFTTARKQKNKIKGAQKAIEKTKKRLKRAREDFIEQKRTMEIKTSTIVEHRKREWFEKFRWFQSSDGILVIAGRDAHTNEVLVKRYMKKGDIFVHATVHGAPHTVILAEGKEIPENTVLEAGQFAVSFSSAWKARVGAADAYYVDPEQVSFTPPSGEYLVRGGVIVRGKRNFLKGMVLETAVGIQIEERYARVIGGPPNAIKAKTDYYIILKPGEETRGTISKQIRAILTNKVPEEESQKISLLDLNEFIRFIPGRSWIRDTES